MGVPSEFTSDKGLAEFNEFLAESSYVEGAPDATPKDFEVFGQLKSTPDASKFPHVIRWYKHVEALKEKFPLREWSTKDQQAKAAKEIMKAKPAITASTSSTFKFSILNYIQNCT